MARNYFTVRSIALSVLGLVGLGALLFIPAGTLNYWQAWVFIVVFAAATQVSGIYLALKDPALLERRLQFGPGASSDPHSASSVRSCFSVFWLSWSSLR